MKPRLSLITLGVDDLERAVRHVASREEVDAVMTQADSAGAHIVKAAADTTWRPRLRWPVST